MLHFTPTTHFTPLRNFPLFCPAAKKRIKFQPFTYAPRENTLYRKWDWAVAAGGVGACTLAAVVYNRAVSSGEEPLEEKTLKIRRSRLEETNRELERLRSQDVLTPEREARITEILDRLETQKISIFPQKNQEEVKVAIARALEIKQLYQESHYVFTHAQRSDWLPTIYLIKELERAFNPSRNLKFFKFFRSPEIYSDLDITVDKCVKVMDAVHQFNAMNVSEQSQLLTSCDLPDSVDRKNTAFWRNLFANIDDHFLREWLLSVDAFLLNGTEEESCMYFLACNGSVFNSQQPNAVRMVNETILKRNLISEGASQHISKLLEKLNQMGEELKGARHGNLFVICIPKEKARDLQYRAHPYGEVCHCHETGAIDLLEELQKDRLTPRTLCNDGSVPQYRLAIPQITPEVGVKVFLITPLTKSDRKKLKEQVAAIAHEVKQLAASNP